MSIILFFGASFVVIIVGFTLVTLTIHHHWKLAKESRLKTRAAAATSAGKKA